MLALRSCPRHRPELPVLAPFPQNFPGGFRGILLLPGRRGVPVAPWIDGKCAFGAHLAPQLTQILPNRSVSFLLVTNGKNTKKRLPIVRLAVFPLAPLAGLEPATCGLTVRRSTD